MKQLYLQVTYRDGRPYVAYLYLPRKPKEKRHRCRRVEPGMVLDINKDGELMGVELTAPRKVTLEDINGVLKEYGLEPLKESDLTPILAA